MLHYIDERLRHIKCVDLPFGDLNVLAAGDLYHLKTVMDSWIFDVPNITYANLTHSAWDAFKLSELSIVMRQDNLIFIEGLNRLRVGSQTSADLLWYMSRCLENLTPPERGLFSIKTPHMFYSNMAVQGHNKQFMDEMDGTVQTLVAEDSLVQQTADSACAQAMLDLAKNLDTRKAGALPYSIDLKIDIPVELAVNVDVPDGLTNGVKGTLRAIEWALFPTRHVACLWVLFDEERIGLQARAKATLQHRRQPCIHTSWTPIARWGARFAVGPRKAVEVHRVQFPVVPCAARTIHKYQGGSLQRAVIGLARYHPGSSNRIHYTAISRLTDPTGLAFTHLNPMGVKASDVIGAHYAHKRAAALLQPNIGHTMLNSSNEISLVTLNFRSLHKNIDNLRRTLASDMYGPTFMVLTET
ncbi:hypothetical protein WJX74_002278 [Apatococcus lobatus]|uniref:Uncharacterized protein n=1 Tax=Apatococcus lobatus TaxID=904363 RepID=A0AAW1RJD8_9CHLO